MSSISSMNSTDNSLLDVISALREAEKTYAAARESSRIAQSAETQALNRLNEAQRKFDAAVDKVKGDSPGGDWRQVKGIGCME